MILSDRDLRALLASGRLVVEPLDPGAVQPSSIDLRVGSQFRVFANSRHPYIDVRQPMEGLTDLVEATEEEPFILHPGEFVLGSTLESVAIPDDVVGRLEGKSSLGRLGLLIHSSLPGSEPVLVRGRDGSVRWRAIEEVVRKQLRGDVVAFDPETFAVDYHQITNWYEGPADRIFEVVLASGRSVQVTAGHNLFTLDRNGSLAKVRTGALVAGTMVAIAGRLPEGGETAELDLLDLVPESDRASLMVEGATIDALFESEGPTVESLLRSYGVAHVGYYRSRSRLPLDIALNFPELTSGQVRVAVKGSSRSLPRRLVVDEDLAWMIGLYVAEGYRRSRQVKWANTDQGILDRVEQTLLARDLPVYRALGSVTSCSSLLSRLLGWLEIGDGAHRKRIPPVVFGWPDNLVEAFLEGFVDGDGSREPTRISLWTSSHRLATDFLALLPRLGLRAGLSARWRERRRLFQVTIPSREHKLLTSVPLPDRLLVALRGAAGLTQREAARLCGYRNPTDLCNIETRRGRDAVRLATVRRLAATYGSRLPDLEEMGRLRRLTDGHVLWDRVLEVRDTGAAESVFDLEVRPGGRRIENFLAGRGGVFVSNTAGFVDAGFRGNLTLELSNVANLPITIYPGMKIGQLCIFQMTSPAERPYGSEELRSKYLGQEGPTPSRFHENFDDRR